MADTRNAKLILDVTTKGADKSAKDIAGVGKSIDKLDKEISSISKDFRSGFDSAGESVDKLTDKLENAARAAKKVDTPKLDTEFSGDVASSSAGLRGAVDVFTGGQGGAIGSLLEITEALADVGEFAPKAASQLTTFAGGLGASVGQLGVAAVIAAPFVIALGLAVDRLQKDIQKSIEAINAGAETVLEVNKFLATANTQQVQDRIKAAEAEKGAVEKTIKDIQDAQKRFLEQSGTSELFNRQAPNIRNLISRLKLIKPK